MGLFVARQAAALLEALNIPVTIYKGRLVVLMSEVCKALLLELRDWSKNYVFTGTAKDLPGFYTLIQGKEMGEFKQAYQRQHGESLTHVRSAYIGDIQMFHSFMNTKIKVDTEQEQLFDSLYDRIEELVLSGEIGEEGWDEAA